MSDALFPSFFTEKLSKSVDLAAKLDIAPWQKKCCKGEKYTRQDWIATMQPYVASVMWLASHFAVNGADCARAAYQKLGVERKALIQIGYEVVFLNLHRFEPRCAYIRPDMFVGVDVKEGEFPVRTLTNMRLGTYLRLTEMGGVAA